ncbi:MAG: OB-fold nucleic acid binding domain-containing protein, partial [Jiangellaceae bacterium]
ADLLRRAMGKKKKEVLDAEFVPFSDGMRANGFSESSIKALWDVLVPFSDYAFNKAHTAAYGLVSYWTAFLKANYPAEYMAALLTSVRDGKDKTALYLSECRRMGIKVLAPDVNESAGDFAPIGTDIRFGLAAIRNVGGNVVDGIVAARAAAGRFESFPDFMDKVPVTVCNKRVIESLIRAGAFDSLGYSRRALVSVHEDAVDTVISLKRNEAIGQFDLFGGAGEESTGFDVVVPDLAEWDKKVKLAHEREMLGLYVSDHPLLGLEHVLASSTDRPISTLADEEEVPSGTTVTIGGLITSMQRKVTKRGDPWAIATVEDLEGAMDVMFFPATYQLHALQLAEDEIVVIKGRLDRRDDSPQLIASELSLPDLSDGPSGPLVVTMPVSRCTPPVVERLKDVLVTHPGVTEVQLKLTSAGRTTVMRLADGLRVTASTALMGDLKALLGPTCVA